MTLDFVFHKCTGHDTAYWSERSELDWFAKYANPRDDSGKGILTANWNHFPRFAASNWPRTAESEAAQTFNWGKDLRALGYTHLIFAIDDAGQFDVRFSVWYKPQEDSE